MALTATGYFYYNNSLKSKLPISDTTVFQVNSGASIKEILENLEKEGLIKDGRILSIYFKLNPEKASSIKAGSFSLSPDNTHLDLIETLNDPTKDRNDISVLIQEGLRYDEIATIINTGFKSTKGSKFSEAEYIKIVENPDETNFTAEAASFLSKHKPSGRNLEGYLYPDTYYFSKDSTALDVINKQIETFSSKLSEKNLTDIEGGNYSLYQYLIIASMIEREAFASEEKPDIADVIFKRLEKGIQGVKLLQIDATLLYQAKNWEADPFKLKAVDSPYNSYKYAGLPPTPISNPGVDSILAALYPSSNDYYFYLHDSNGVIHFARNQSEHNANVNKYIN